nr:hypothetical protein [Solirubrobacterales bacterium]
VVRVLAASALLGVITWVVHAALDALLGRSLPAQVVAVGVALVAGLTAYAAAVLTLRVPEAARIAGEARRRLVRN